MESRLRSVGDARQLLAELNVGDFDVVHLQYPSRYGWSLMPHLLTWRHRWLVTLHEVTEAHPLRRTTLPLLFCRSPFVIFTAERQRQAVCRVFPSVLTRSRVIPIGSNIDAFGNGYADSYAKLDNIVYFGLLRPNKGIEDFIELASLARFSARLAGFTFGIVGSVPAGGDSYFCQLKKMSDGLPITWSVGLTDGEVARRLAVAKFGYLPFPDGASERRGSLLALMGSGVCVVTRTGACTPPSLRGAVSFADDSASALTAIEALAASDQGRVRILRRAREYVDRHSWRAIALEHAEVYGNVVSSAAAPCNPRDHG